MPDGILEVAILPNEFGPHRRARPASMTDRAGTAPGRRMVKVLPEGWIRERVEERMLAAGRVLRKCEMPTEMVTLARVLCAYPAVIHDRHDHALWEPRGMTPLRPSTSELTELDVFLGWLLWIRPEERPVVFAHAWGASFRLIQRLDPLHRSHTTQRKRYRAGIDQVLARLRATDSKAKPDGWCCPK